MICRFRADRLRMAENDRTRLQRYYNYMLIVI